MLHKGLTKDKWCKLTLAEQLGNVGSEFERAWGWREKGQEQLSRNAMDRMLELLDLTITDKRWYGPKLKELTRLREEIRREYFEENVLSPSHDLRKYFLSFAVLARADR